MKLGTNGRDKDLVIDKDGNVGIGTAPADLIEVESSRGAADQNLLNILAVGSVGIGTASPGSMLEVAGEVTIDPPSGTPALTFNINNMTKGRIVYDQTFNTMRTITNYQVNGYLLNLLNPGVTGAVIAGGGNEDGNNVVSDSFGVIGGGANNRAGDNAGTTSDRSYATVAGGIGNYALGSNSSVGGGANNWATASNATVAGGSGNTAAGLHSSVGGGSGNEASNEHSCVVGGGGNKALGFYSFVGGGVLNKATHSRSVVAGGEKNLADYHFATVCGGLLNNASGNGAFVGGGGGNKAWSQGSTVGGGTENEAFGESAIVGGGENNNASGFASTVSGGANNTAGGDFSFATGRRAKVRDTVASGDMNGDEGTFIWADSTDADFTSTGPNQFLIRSGGGIGINKNNPVPGTLDVAGSALFSGNIGIGTANPSTALHVRPTGGSNNVVATIDSSGGFSTVDFAELGVPVWTVGKESAASGSNFSIRETGVASRMFVALGTGNVGIGTTNPTAQLHIDPNTDSVTAINIDSGTTSSQYSAIDLFDRGTRKWGMGKDANNRFYIDEASVATRFMITAGGNVGLSRIPSANRLEVAGEASKDSGGDWLVNSDARIKTDVQTVTKALDTLDKVRLVDFRYTDEYRAAHPSIDDRRYLNVIAQEFAEVFPDHVKSSGEKLPGSGDEILQVDTFPLTIYSAAAVQELYELVREQAQALAEREREFAQVRELEKAKERRIEHLEARLAAIEAILADRVASNKGESK